MSILTMINNSGRGTKSCSGRYLTQKKSTLPAEVIPDYAHPCSIKNVLDPTSSDHHKVEELLQYYIFFYHVEMITNQKQSKVLQV